MLWKVEYSNYHVNPDFANGKELVMKKALDTMQRFPYLTGDFYKFRGDEKIYVESYVFDVRKWNASGRVSLKKVQKRGS